MGFTCHVPIADQPDAGAGLAALPDEVRMPGPVQDTHSDIPAGDSPDEHLPMYLKAAAKRKKSADRPCRQWCRRLPLQQDLTIVAERKLPEIQGIKPTQRLCILYH